jgi:hypothetical protein
MSAPPRVVIGLSAVVVAAGPEGPEVLVSRQGAAAGLPFGSFDPAGHRTFELAVRDFVTAQTGFALGYVEQLYTFGDLGREAPLADMGEAREDGGAPRPRVVSVGYLALAGRGAQSEPRAGEWAAWSRFFPWEDRRTPAGEAVLQAALPALQAWATNGERRARLALAFGLDGRAWHEERVLERYELLYEAGLAPEAARDRGQNSPAARDRGQNSHAARDARTFIAGEPLASDHRRILATAIGRLRAKIKYRPIVFDLAPETFTLGELQDLVEALCGVSLHKQNFRRAVERSGLVEPTGAVRQVTGGRPAQLFMKSAVSRTAGAPGLSLPLDRRASA